MELRLISILQCPLCKQSLELKAKYKELNEDLIGGKLSCTCSEYYVIQGIVIFDKKINNSIKLLINEDFNYDASYEKILSFITEQKSEIIFSNNVFSKACQALFDQKFVDYLTYRYSCKSFFESIAFFPIVQENLILDLGSGAGHFSSLMSFYFSNTNIVSADQNLLLLLISKKYFGLKNLVLADFDKKFPFMNKVFSTVFCSDTFHYIDNKELASSEMKRVVSQEGIILILHLHNYLQNNYFPGKPLTPEKYSSLFENSKTFSNKIILKDYFEKDSLDLKNIHSIEDLNSSQTLSLVYSQTGKIYEKFDNLLSFFFVEKLYLPNKIYKIKNSSNKLILELENLSLLYVKEHLLEEKYFPRTLTIFKKDFSDRKKLIGFVKNFILIPEDLANIVD